MKADDLTGACISVSNSALISTCTTCYEDDCSCFSVVTELPKERLKYYSNSIYCGHVYVSISFKGENESSHGKRDGGNVTCVFEAIPMTH